MLEKKWFGSKPLVTQHFAGVQAVVISKTSNYSRHMGYIDLFPD